ncbi:MAG: hypothetical protein M1812_007716 [Candelaria pacifica]|nr:MAG: hypothetical protein M1812_007716 [Candelaria pacifica]
METYHSARPSSSSGSAPTLRRTPRLEEQRPTYRAISAERVPGVRFAESVRLPSEDFSADREGSTTPRASFESPSVPLHSRTAHPATRISRRTASAITYALEEGLRTPNLFTADLIEESAPMSDLVGGGSGGSGRSNGGSRATSGPRPVPQAPRTPRDVMRDRAARETKKKAEADAAREREREEEENRRAREERRISSERRTASGTAAGGPVGGGGSGYRRSSVAGGSRNSGGEPGASQETGRRQGDRISSGNPARPVGAQPTAFTAAVDREEERLSHPRGTYQGTSDGAPGTTARPRGSSASQGQPRTVSAVLPPVQPQEPHGIRSEPQQPQARQPSGTRPSTQAQDGPSAAATGTASQSAQPQPATANPPQRKAPASSFPHAFERWETLSSHWEGLTSYWIRRLEQNSEEVSREPLSQQMARQITDLSAAGANLFHAVVELQRLRASSERKFQRWFFETRSEQERAQEMQGQLENALRLERAQRAEAVAGATEVQQIKANAERMVSEKNRELQIAKEEARRAWDELGRREQEERDKVTSLKDGRPTIVGGVQVVPMPQAVPSQQPSSAMPSAHGGSYPGGPSGSAMGGQARQGGAESSIEDQQGYADYGPDDQSPTDTDPFTEVRRDVQPPLPREKTAPTSSTSAQPQYPPRSSSNNGASRAVYPTVSQPTSSAPSQPPSTSAPVSTYLNYSQAPQGQTSSAPFYQHQGSSLQGAEQFGVIQSDQRSLAHSNDDTYSEEEEFQIDDQGNVLHGADGRPLILRSGARSTRSEDSDEYDVRHEQERERDFRARYGSGAQQQSQATSANTTTGGTNQPAYNNQGGRPDYSGAGYAAPGWENVANTPRHHHPTRLSDVLEEDERSRTSASRASQTSRGFH